MPQYFVTFIERWERAVYLTAASEEEAVEKALSGDWDEQEAFEQSSEEPQDIMVEELDDEEEQDDCGASSGSLDVTDVRQHLAEADDEGERTMSFMEALVSCALHGEMSEQMVHAWIDKADQDLALKIVRSTHLHKKREELVLLREIEAWSCGDTEAQRTFARIWGERLAPYADFEQEE